MRSLTFLGAGALEWREVPDAVVTETTDVVVRPLAVAACDLDVGAVAGIAPAPGPYPFGHEFVGEVVDAGDAVRHFQVGDAVVVPFQISCGQCDACRAGRTASCGTVPPGSMYGFGSLGGGDQWGGAYADLVRVPFADAMLMPLPDGVLPQQAASASDNLADGWRCVVGPLAQRPGSEVLVVAGHGSSIGLWAAEWAGLLGAARVFYVDPDPGRLAIAEAAGATPVEGPYPRKAGSYDVTVDASGEPDGLTCALRSTARDGICTSAAMYWQPVDVPLLDMYAKGITFLTSRVHSRAALPHVLDALFSGQIDPLRFATVVHFADVPAALAERPYKLVALAG